MNCKICNKPIVLGPTAAERAAKDTTGKTATYYTNLFQTHATCALEQRSRETTNLLKKLHHGR